MSASGDDLINIDRDPWKAMPREHVKLKSKMFREEVMRSQDEEKLTLDG